MAVSFRLFGIPVRVHLLFWLAAVLWGSLWTNDWVGLCVWVAVVFQGLLTHELAHAVTGWFFGRTPRIELVALGGFTWWEQQKPLNPGRSLIVSAAGPAVGILLGTLCLLALSVFRVDHAMLAYKILTCMVWVNLGWGAFNLLPIIPLDGGNIVASSAELVMAGRGRLFSTYVSFALIAILIVAFGLAQAYFVVILLFMLGFLTYQVYAVELQRSKSDPSPSEPSETLLLEQAFMALERSDGYTLVQIATQLVTEAGSTEALDEAFHLLSWGRLLTGEPLEAQAALSSMSGTRTADPVLQGAVLTELGKLSEAFPFLKEGCKRGGTFAEDYFVKAVIQLGAFSEATDFLTDPGAPKVSLQTVSAVESASLEAKAFEAVRKLATFRFERVHEPLTAVEVARCWVRCGDPESALQWLVKAHEVGFDDGELLDRDQIFEAVRHLPEWVTFRTKLDPKSA